MSNDRPDPDALLRSEREGRGRLKLFLGAAPGVGKTFEMLRDGAERKRDGADVVIGVVETHGRAETEALVHGHELIPRRPIAHEGHGLAEMDLDAILARHPKIALVDELAHSNAPGSRHPKRYQDVEELLAAGIDVHSTINVQHVESLNDVVASFTRVRVRETVPDRILEMAEIELVDLPPDELIERLKAGKVYIPEEASRALGHFFSKSNLSALRELALRRAAQTVDTQMLDYVRGHALAGTWAGGERLVVAISELPGSDTLVRVAKRIADALHAPWTALHVETPRALGFGEEARERLSATMALATRLGGVVASIPAPSPLAGIKAFLGEARATQLIVGKSARSRWFEMRHGSVVDRLIRETPGVAVHVLPLDAAKPAAASPAPAKRWDRRAYLWTTALVAGATAIAQGLFAELSLGNTALLYLVPVMVAASRFGRGPGLYAGILSSLAYNFFFLPPVHTLTISNPENVVTVAVLLGVAIVTSQLAASVRAQADLASASARANAALAGFLRRLTASGQDAEAGHIVCAEIARLFDVRTVLMQPSPDGPRIAAAYPPEDRLDDVARAAAGWTLDHGQPAGRGSETLTASDWMFSPLVAAGGIVAALGIAREDGRDPVRPDRMPLLASLLEQAALVLERVRLQDEMRALAVVKEREGLRAALLSSVSHDLRTPLTAILGTATELRREADGPLVRAIEAEARRLDRFVANLLDMARVEAGALALTREAIDLTDAVSAAVHDVRRTLDGRRLVLHVSPDLPLVRADPQLLHQCLVNLLDNAGRYGTPGTPITIAAERVPGALLLAILDEGPGLPQGAEGAPFETFRRIGGSDRAVGGTGLGLAIVRGFAEAMGIGVSAANRGEPHGARFTLRFPEALLVREMTA